MRAEIDDIGALNEGGTLGLRIDLSEFLFAVRAYRCEILSFDDCEGYFTHKGSPPWLPFHVYAWNRGIFRVVHRTIPPIGLTLIRLTTIM